MTDSQCTPTHKRCRTCRDTKPLIEFGRRTGARYRDGLASWCKSCASSYWRAHRLKPRKPRLSLKERFWIKVVRGGPDDCWLWQGARFPFGYGEFMVRHGQIPGRAHRLAWEFTNGRIPNGLHVLHRCDNPPCCNPSHLFLGTNADNRRDSMLKRRHPKHKQTHCKRGHEFTVENTIVIKGRWRQCRQCYLERARRRSEPQQSSLFREQESAA